MVEGVGRLFEGAHGGFQVEASDVSIDCDKLNAKISGKEVSFDQAEFTAAFQTGLTGSMPTNMLAAADKGIVVDGGMAGHIDYVQDPQAKQELIKNGTEAGAEITNTSQMNLG